MMAIIWKRIGRADYFYGKYNFNTQAEKNFVNVLALKIAQQEDVDTWVEEVEVNK